MRAAYPWAKAVLLLVWAYAPPDKASRRAQGTHILQSLPYYIASNKAYHAARALEAALQAAGIRAEKANIPLRTVAAASGIGRVLRNALLTIPPYGSRIVLQGLMVDAEPQTSDRQAHGVEGRFSCPSPKEPKADESQIFSSACTACGACVRACPAGAIDEDGYHVGACLRAHTGGADIPAWAAKILPGLLGCERCQEVCPVNARLATRALSAAEQEAFSLQKLLAGDLAAALELVGKNQKKRLLSQTSILTGKFTKGGFS